MEFFNSAVDVLQTLVIAWALALVSGASSICWRGTAMTILGLKAGHETAHGGRRRCLIGMLLVPQLTGLFS